MSRPKLRELKASALAVITPGIGGAIRPAHRRGLGGSDWLRMRRVVLRFSSSSLIGMASLMLAQWYFNDYMLSGAVGIVAGVLGADVTSALYVKHLARLPTQK